MNVAGRMAAAALGWLVLGSTTALAADPRFRADDGSLWHLMDNPALLPAQGGASVGYAARPRGGDWSNPTSVVRMALPFAALDYTGTGTGGEWRWGAAVGPWSGLSLGYQSDLFAAGGDQARSLGLLWRPLDVLSIAATVDGAWGPNPQWGGGVALRPLALAVPGGEALTLTGDLSGSLSSVAWERWGARLAWGGADVRMWYEPGTGSPGVEVTLGLGPSETTLSAGQAGQALRWTPRTAGAVSFGPIIVKVRGNGLLAAAPGTALPFGLGGPRWDLPTLTALLERASRNPQVAAVAIEDPPVVGGLASAEALRSAVDLLHRAGKKLYVHADLYAQSLGYQGWIAAADRVALDPSGSLLLTSGGSRRLYLKTLLDKIGIEFVNFAPWDTKSANNTLTFASMPDGERSMLRRFLTDRDSLAAAALASGRGTRLRGDPVGLVSGGPYLVAQDALERGLIDAVENRADFETFLATEHPGATVVETLPETPPPGWGPTVTGRTVAVVHLIGDIIPGPGQVGRSIGRAAAETLRTLRADASIRAVLLRVDSPGGAVLPSDALADEVKKTVAAGKPVVVVMGDVAASGGYYLSAPATRIFAEPGTLTGSIGVTAALFTAPKALDLLGIHADGVDQGASSGFGDWTRPLTEDARQRWSAQIQAIYRRFLAVVAEGRHLDPAKLEPLARGQIYTGREALALGLVDELGGQNEAEMWLTKTLGGPVVWKDYLPGQADPLETLLGPLAKEVVAASDSPTLLLTAALDRWASPWAEALAGVSARGPGPQVWLDAP